jgi:EAL domain-containing protein (putative c-di-GMP-specific phosphodiesterase class I)/CheY-like chemotaxis protein
MTPTVTSLRILAVDDESFQLKLLTRQLGNAGHADVLASTSADHALALVQQDIARFDVICCDLQMPEMDGVEFVRHLGDARYRGGLVLISGEDDRILQTTRRLAQAHGLRVLAALHKPVGPEQLSQALQAAVDGPGPGSPAARIYSPEEVRRAITERQLVLHFQPQVELSTGRLMGVETLVRWQHPQDGLVYPDRFIGVAEDNGLIDELTRAILIGPGGALAQARAWQDEGVALQVSVNVSMLNLTEHSFPGFVAQALADAGLPPSRLMLEVTESRLMEDPLVTLDVLTRLRLKRIGLSIDDFGTGHSSLAQLRDVPFDELKIDRGFVNGACREAVLRAILEPSLDMGKQLGIRTVAEGVEDVADWMLLRSRGCDLAQGYFIARPMPAERLRDWLTTWEMRRAGLTGHGA